MEFSWTDEQQTGCRQAREFAERELNDGLREREQRGELSRELWLRCARFGIQGLTIPETWGGLGLDVRSAVRILEGLGEGCHDNGLLMSLGAQVWSVTIPLLQFGNAEQKQFYLPRMASGEWIGAFALTEAQGGSDAFRLMTRAERHGSGFRLRGSKVFITNAPVADLFLVFATTDPAAGYFGITAFLLPPGLAGLSIGAPTHKMGLQTSPMAELHFDDVAVDESMVLGEVGGGGAVVRPTLEWERGLLLAASLGTMQRLLQVTAQYTRERKQFGRPIMDFEAVAHQLAEMRLRLELSRLLVYQFAWLKDQHRSAGLEASMTKLYVSESLCRVAELAMHLHGAYGYTREYEFERDWRDAMASTIYSGTTEMQKNLIAESLHRLAARAIEEVSR